MIHDQMLYSQSKLDTVFQGIMQTALEFELDFCRDDFFSDDEILCGYSEQIASIFSRGELPVELEKLLSAHKSDQLYQPTNYHWLLLDWLLLGTADDHNDVVADGEEGRHSDLGVKQIDAGALSDLYFWDNDFLIPPEWFDSMPWDKKQSIVLLAKKPCEPATRRSPSKHVKKVKPKITKTLRRKKTGLLKMPDDSKELQ